MSILYRGPYRYIFINISKGPEVVLAIHNGNETKNVRRISSISFSAPMSRTGKKIS